jgi:hypothetical protein
MEAPFCKKMGHKREGEKKKRSKEGTKLESSRIALR